MPVGPIDYSQTLDCLLAIAYCLLAPHCQLPRLTGSQPGRLLPFAYCQLTIACLPHYLLFNSLSTVNCPLPIYSPCLLFNSLSTVNCPLPIYSLPTANCLFINRSFSEGWLPTIQPLLPPAFNSDHETIKILRISPVLFFPGRWSIWSLSF